MSFNNSHLKTIVEDSQEDNIEILFAQLKIDQTKMTTPVLKTEYINMVPEFNGEAQLLSRFLETCEKLVNRFYNTANPEDFQNEYLMSSIRSKIKGDAALNISNCIINNWQDLKSSLLHAYGDKRDVCTLCIEMTNLKQTNESPFDFYSKIQKLLNLEQSYVKTHCSPNEAVVLSNFFNNYALRILLRGLKDPIGSLMRTKNPQNLSQALNMLTNDFQLETSQKTPTFQPLTRQPLQKNQNPNFRSNNNQFRQNFNTQRYNSNFNSQRPNTSFNSQNFRPNLQNSPMKRTFSNVTPHNYGPNKMTTNQYRPTPMSISTNNTFNPNQNRNNSGQLYNLDENNIKTEFNLEQIEPNEFDENNFEQEHENFDQNEPNDFLDLEASE